MDQTEEEEEAGHPETYTKARSIALPLLRTFLYHHLPQLDRPVAFSYHTTLNIPLARKVADEKISCRP